MTELNKGPLPLSQEERLRVRDVQFELFSAYSSIDVLKNKLQNVVNELATVRGIDSTKQAFDLTTLAFVE